MARQRRQRHDSASKLLFSRKELVADLIRGYVDPTAAGGMDLRTLQRCNGTYVAPDLRERRNDVVWRVRSRHGWIYVYLLIEFQSTVDRYMAVRLLGYVALLWQDLIAQQRLAPDGLLPPVLPIVLYNGDQVWSAPTELRLLLAPAPAFLAQYQPQARHLFLDETRAATRRELGLRNLVAAIFALEQNADFASQHRLVRQLRVWLRGRHDLKDVIGTWYAEVVAPTGLLGLRPGATISIDKVEPMLATRMMKEVRRLRAVSHAEGIVKGIVKGEARGIAKALLNLVRSETLPASQARSEIRRMRKARTLSREAAEQVLAQLKQLK